MVGAQRKGRARWPYVVCPPGGVTTAADLLCGVIFDAARGDAPNLDLVVRRALDLAAGGWASNLPNDECCRRVEEAARHARAHEWFQVAEALKE